MAKRGGIGLGLAEPELKVQYIVEGGPAAEAQAFDVGDKLVAVDDTDVHLMRLKDVATLIVGEEGTQVAITVEKIITAERKTIILTRRGAGTKASEMPNPPPPEPERPASPPKAIFVENPTFDPPPGHQFPPSFGWTTYTVTIECATEEAEIRYSVDGSPPTRERPGTMYAGGGIQVSGTMTIYATAMVYTDSATYTSDAIRATYSIADPPPQPSTP
eukprot:CAMPEP_0181314228 /NCGR_PEP_ID=MMETSP1101-20121128/14696_1 /TAXON_ID=46948 /ORGANISM="Rhodomonas abbreviata, Strain Caron Lab Isolate" /LENGTH=216 /DNA_ID=CAMNT_0023421287 /DNA_START=215 /DNA_END=862 /DNA_ORIENTATION=+